MEPIWILMFLGAILLGWVMGRSGVSSEFNRLRLEVEDALDRINHLYDRTRKRLASRSFSTNVEENTDHTPPKTAAGRKAELRRRALERGLLGVYAPIHHRGIEITRTDGN